MSMVDVTAIGRTMQTLLERDGRPLHYEDPATHGTVTLSPLSAASPDGLLPALVVAGEAVWREATGNGFQLEIVHNPDALLGYGLRGIGAGTFTTVMLATMEATSQIARLDAFVINDLHVLWSAASERHDMQARPALEAVGRAAPGTAP
jgi:hypothetical protein